MVGGGDMATRTRWWVASLLVLAASAGPAHGAGAPDLPDRAAPAAANEIAVDLGAIRDRAGSMPIDARIDMDKRIGATVERVNRSAAEQGQAAVAARLAAEFSVPTESLFAEKAEYGWSWGQVLVARTLLANSTNGVTLRDLATLREEGWSWASIAYGLQFRMEDLEDAIKAQGRVVMGSGKPDGKAEVIGK
jgi:hypothetical protein